VGHDRNAVANPLDLAQKVAVEEHSRALRLQARDQLAHVATADRVEIGGRFVQDQQLRPAEDGLCEAEALLHALGGVQYLAALARKRAPLQCLGCAPATLARGQPHQASEIVEHLVRVEVLWKVRLLRGEADLRPCCDIARR
jgi:hypothetical protein